jgi:O-antigen ligase
MRRMGFALALVFIFNRFSFLHEIIIGQFHVNLYLLFIIGIPVSTLAFLSGGLPRVLSTPAARFWALLIFWMLLSTPFSTWRSASLQTVFQYVRVSAVMMVIIGGLTWTLKECRQAMYAVAWAGLLNVLYSKFFSTNEMSRLTIASGSIGNSNDFAAHLLLVLPIVLWAAQTTRVKVIRLGAYLVFAAGVLAGAGTGSRGAMVAAVVVAMYAFFRASGSGKVVVLTIVPILAASLIMFTPNSIKQRYMTLFSDEITDDSLSEAVMSSEARKHLLNASIRLSLSNPIFGVGPGEFMDTEGKLATAAGQRGLWQVTHNTYTQIASECGIPALIFFLCGIAATFKMLNTIYRAARPWPELRWVYQASFYLTISLLGFSTAIIFLSMAYSMYLPSMIGLVIALHAATNHEVARLTAAASRAPAAATPEPLPYPRRRALTAMHS